MSKYLILELLVLVFKAKKPSSRTHSFATVLSPQSSCPLATLPYDLWFAPALDFSGASLHSGALSAYRTNSTLLEMPNFSKIRKTQVGTVCSRRLSLREISLFLMPSATRRTTSCSRRVSRAIPPAL